MAATSDLEQRIEVYLRMSGQTRQQLFGGEWDYGFDYIVDVLIPDALAERKRIVWYYPPDRIDGAEVRWERVD